MSRKIEDEDEDDEKVFEGLFRYDERSVVAKRRKVVKMRRR